MSKKNSIVLKHKNCFEKFEHINKIFNNFKKKILSEKNKSFLVGVSGGPDSLALAAMCKAFEYENSSTKFHYVNINHGIRKNSKKESLKVKNLLKKHKINLKIVNNSQKIKKNIQHNARSIRYNLLRKECIKNKIKTIITAHHQDDQIETFLIRLSRGSGIQGLSSMNQVSKLDKSIKILRPLLSDKKKELIKISTKVFGTYIVDPSNKDSKFLRVKMRKLLPILKKYGIEEKQIAKSIDNLQSTSNTMKYYYKEIFKTIISKKRNNLFIKKKDFFSFNQEIRIKILGNSIRSLTKSYYPPRASKIKNAISALHNQGNGLNYSLSGCLISQDQKLICVKKMRKN